MKIFLYVAWAMSIIIGNVCGVAIPADSKYMVGFIFGCISLTLFIIARRKD